MEHNNLLINAMPAPTYNWLKMNDAYVQVPGNVSEGNPFVTRRKDVAIDVTDYDSIKEIPGGMGTAFDSFIHKSNVSVLTVVSKEGQKVTDPVRIDFDYKNDTATVNAIYIEAQDNSELTVIMDFSGEKKGQGFAAVQTKVRVGKNARVLLVQAQRLGSGFTFLNDIASRVSDQGRFEEIELILSGNNTYQGSRTDLLGKESTLKTDLAYLLKNNEHLDMNHIANHIGKKTVSDIDVDGVLRDHSSKLFRGTIDLRKGAKGAVGNELEDVLLMDDEVINQTIPVILCNEDDVEGNHGATIGRLDDELLFYMESRGMNREEVYEMMANARISAVIAKIPDEETRKKLSESL